MAGSLDLASVSPEFWHLVLLRWCLPRTPCPLFAIDQRSRSGFLDVAQKRWIRQPHWWRCNFLPKRSKATSYWNLVSSLACIFLASCADSCIYPQWFLIVHAASSWDWPCWRNFRRNSSWEALDLLRRACSYWSFELLLVSYGAHILGHRWIFRLRSAEIWDAEPTRAILVWRAWFRHIHTSYCTKFGRSAHSKMETSEAAWFWLPLSYSRFFSIFCCRNIIARFSGAHIFERWRWKKLDPFGWCQCPKCCVRSPFLGYIKLHFDNRADHLRGNAEELCHWERYRSSLVHQKPSLLPSFQPQSDEEACAWIRQCKSRLIWPNGWKVACLSATIWPFPGPPTGAFWNEGFYSKAHAFWRPSKLLGRYSWVYLYIHWCNLRPPSDRYAWEAWYSWTPSWNILRPNAGWRISQACGIPFMLFLICQISCNIWSSESQIECLCSVTLTYLLHETFGSFLQFAHSFIHLLGVLDPVCLLEIEILYLWRCFHWIPALAFYVFRSSAFDLVLFWLSLCFPPSCRVWSRQLLLQDEALLPVVPVIWRNETISERFYFCLVGRKWHQYYSSNHNATSLFASPNNRSPEPDRPAPIAKFWLNC